MSTRDNILRRLRRGRDGWRSRGPSAVDERRPDAEVFADYPQGSEKAVEQFETKLAALNGRFYRAADLGEAARTLEDILAPLGGERFIAHEGSLIREVLAHLPELAWRIDGEEMLAATSDAFSAYAAGISEATALVARTGSVALNSRDAGGRRLTVLPPIHIVLARRTDLLPSIDAALERLGGDDLWSNAVLITGPSRTADIEKILILGAHGPKELHVILVG